jgi:DNA-binding response OmpR family regulator
MDLVKASPEKRRRILIVDDDENICSMLRSFFESLGYDVRTCMSSVDLFRDIRDVDADLILLDVMMSWVDGYRVCRLLKSNAHTRHIPVLMISARSGDEDIRRGLAAKAEDYFVKPFNLSRLQGRVRELLAADRLPN